MSHPSSSLPRIHAEDVRAARVGTDKEVIHVGVESMVCKNMGSFSISKSPSHPVGNMLKPICKWTTEQTLGAWPAPRSRIGQTELHSDMS